MNKVLIILIFSFSLALSNQNNIGQDNKLSELEMFLFKIGFQGLLNDVKDIKMQSNINTKDLENITNKLEYVFAEITKNKTNIDGTSNNFNSSQDVSELKSIISKLEQRIDYLEQNSSKNIVKNEYISKKTNDLRKTKIIDATVNTEYLEIYSKPYIKSKVIKSLLKDEVIELKSCDKFGWCKVNNEVGYVKKHLVKIVY